MAETARSPASVTGQRGQRGQPSRLQRRAPASLQLSPSGSWNVAIPLLSPLVSPSSDRTVEIASRPDDQRRHVPDAEKPTSAAALKKWQRLAASFCHEPSPPVRPFVPV